MNYRLKIIKGLGWLSLLRITTQIVAFAKLGVISRILSPNDFGLFAIVTTTLTTYETLSETGLNYAVIHMQSNIKQVARSILLVNIGRGIILSIIILISGTFIARFFNNKSLFNFLIAASIIPLARGFINPYIINFQKNLSFNKEFIYRFIPAFANTLFTVAFVIVMKSTWALIIGLIASTIIEVFVSYIITERNLSYPINKKYLLKLFSYGKWITTGGLLSYLSTQIDNIFIGKFLGPANLGLYDFAFRLANISFTEITNTVSQVMFPLYSKKQKRKDSLLSVFKKNVISMFVPATLLAIPLIFFPKEILTFLFGIRWAGGSEVLRILSIYGLLRATIGPLGPLFLSVGKPDILTKVNILNFLIILVLLYPLLRLYGIIGVALAMTISYIIVLPVYIFYTVKLFKIK